jgi:hypothetical protein
VVLSVAALPHESTLSKRQGLGVVSTVTTLTQAQVSSFVPFAEFARAAYCDVSAGTDCGIACDANPGFTVAAYGGDGNSIQQCLSIRYFCTNDAEVSKNIQGMLGTGRHTRLSSLLMRERIRLSCKLTITKRSSVMALT